MTDELRARPGAADPVRAFTPAQARSPAAAPNITADRRAILAELDYKAAASERYRDWPERVPGVPIGAMPGHAGALCYKLNTHRLVIGKSDAGKASAGIVYMLLHDDEHAIVLLDPKSGSVARLTAGYRQTLGPVHIVDPYNATGFFDRRKCASFNPFDALDPYGTTLVEDAANLASALCYLPNGGGDDHSFWDRSARMFTHALILHLVTAPGENADLLRLWELLTYPGSRFLEEVVEPMKGNTACGGTVSRFGNALAQHALGNMRSFSDVLGTIRSYLSWIEFQQIRAVTERSTFNFSEVRDHGGTVYIVMRDANLTICASWVRLMLQSARLGLEKSRSGRPVHFIIDETAALGKFDLISTGLRAWRESKIRLHLFYQGIGQIKESFATGWSAITGTDVLQFMGCGAGDLDTAEFISKALGERDMIVPSTGDSYASTQGRSASQTRGRSTTETSGTSANRSEATTRTVGSSWSTTVGESHTVGTSSSTAHSSTSGWSGNQATSSSSTSTTYGSSESRGTSHSDTEGGSKSLAEGVTVGSGTSQSNAIGGSKSATRGTSQSETQTTNRSFTLQLRRTMRPEQVRMLPDDQMIVIAGSREPALVHKEHYFRNPRLVARAVLRFDPTRPGPVPREPALADQAVATTPASAAPKPSLLGSLLALVRPSDRD